MIDPHVHCRDGQQAYKETIAHALEVARQQGVERIFDMPNTKPPVTREKDVIGRLKLVPKKYEGRYFLWIGATSNEGQLKEAVECYRKYDEVIGFKLYAGKSVGNLAVVAEEEQRKIYRTLQDLGYKGVVAAHTEKQELLKPEVWDPENPVTHSSARPKEAEIESVKDQIRFARETGFTGRLHIVHISCPESVDLVEEAKGEMKITCGATPHHLLWSKEMLKRPDGLLYKMNPPLREKEDVEGLRERLKQGKIDWIETDHAPHAVGEKLYPPYSSGYPSLYIYKKFVTKVMPGWGIDEEMIKSLTEENIRSRFGEKIE